MKSSTSSSKMSTSIIGDDWTKLSLATLQRPHQGPPSQRKYLDQSQVELLTDLCRDYLSISISFPNWFSFVIVRCHLSNHFCAVFTTRIWRFVMLPGLVDVEKRFVCEAFATLIAEECGHLSFNVYYQLVWWKPIPPKTLTLYLQLCICSQF